MVKPTDLSDMYGISETSVDDYRAMVLDLRDRLLQAQVREEDYRRQIQELDHTIDQLVEIVVQREAACYALKTLVESMVKELETCGNREHHLWADPNSRSNAYQHRFNEEVKRLRGKYGKES